MSKKLLSETQVRRFQALANVPTVSELGHYGDRDEEEVDLEMGEELPGDEGPVELPGDEGPEDMGMELSDEGGDDLDLSPEQKEGLAADIVRAVAQELESALNLDEPIEVAVEDELGGEEGLPMDLEEPPLGGEEELPMDLGAEEELEEPLEEGDEEELAEVVDDEAVVKEVLRRVVARLASKK